MKNKYFSKEIAREWYPLSVRFSLSGPTMKMTKKGPVEFVYKNPRQEMNALIINEAWTINLIKNTENEMEKKHMQFSNIDPSNRVFIEALFDYHEPMIKFTKLRSTCLFDRWPEMDFSITDEEALNFANAIKQAVMEAQEKHAEKKRERLCP